MQKRNIPLLIKKVCVDGDMMDAFEDRKYANLKAGEAKATKRRHNRQIRRLAKAALRETL